MKFIGKIKETLSREIELEADSREEAMQELERMYDDSEVVLNDSDFEYPPDFEIIPEQERCYSDHSLIFEVCEKPCTLEKYVHFFGYGYKGKLNCKLVEFVGVSASMGDVIEGDLLNFSHDNFPDADYRTKVMSSWDDIEDLVYNDYQATAIGMYDVNKDTPCGRYYTK